MASRRDIEKAVKSMTKKRKDVIVPPDKKPQLSEGAVRNLKKLTKERDAASIRYCRIRLIK